MNAHHILGYAKHRSHRTELSNGATLCEECHTEFHSTYGVRKFTGDDFYEFIGEALGN